MGEQGDNAGQPDAIRTEGADAEELDREQSPAGSTRISDSEAGTSAPSASGSGSSDSPTKGEGEGATQDAGVDMEILGYDDVLHMEESQGQEEVDSDEYAVQDAVLSDPETGQHEGKLVKVGLNRSGVLCAMS